MLETSSFKLFVLIGLTIAFGAAVIGLFIIYDMNTAAILLTLALTAASVVGLRWWRLIEMQAEQSRELRQAYELLEQRTVQQENTNKRLQQEIIQRQRMEETLATKAAEDAVVGERNRLARELHDAVSQTLFSASLVAEVLPTLWKTHPEEAATSTEELTHLTRAALAEMRTLLLELRPSVLTQTRIEDLVRQLVNALSTRTQVPIELQIEGSRRLPPDVQVVVYRVLQESLNNVIKHSRAARVRVGLQLGAGGARLCVRDDGKGFSLDSASATSLGLRIMRERADSIGAELEILSSPGKGTEIVLLWTDLEREA